MRLDKFLKVSRLIKRRTVANEACDAGRVFINEKPAKASANVKVGDILTILVWQQGCESGNPGCSGNGQKRRSKRVVSLSVRNPS